MDERACWFDVPSNTNIHVTGSRSVPVKSTGDEEDNFIILTTGADGMKKKPFMVFSGKDMDLSRFCRSFQV